MIKRADEFPLKIIFRGGHQGESIVIQTPSGKCGLIDCYSKEKDNLLDYLKNNSISEIEFLCITHPHTDHYRGVKQLIEQIKIRNIYLYESIDNIILLMRAIFAKKYSDNELRIANKELRESIELIHNNSSISLNSLLKNMIILSESNLKIECISPSKGFVNHLDSSINEILREEQNTIEISKKKSNTLVNSYSGVIVLKYQDVQILFAADAEKSNWKEIEKYLIEGENKIDIYKVSHHGSRNSITELFLNSNFLTEESFSVVFPFKKHNLPDDEIIAQLKQLKNHEVLSLCDLKKIDSQKIWQDMILDVNVLTEYDNFSSFKVYTYIDENKTGIIEISINKKSKIFYVLKGEAVRL